MRPRRFAKSFAVACRCANTYAPSAHRLPRQFTHLTIPCLVFLKFRFLRTYLAKGFLAVAGSHERLPNYKGRLVLGAVFRVPFRPPLRVHQNSELRRHPERWPEWNPEYGR